MMLPETLNNVLRFKINEILKSNMKDTEKEDEIVKFVFDAISCEDYRLIDNRKKHNG